MLEIACFNLESCIVAQKAGAHRIELCEDYASGGITPSNELIQKAGAQLKIPLHVIIRPRPGNFVYSPQEIQQMKEAVAFCKENNVDGVVFGVLTKDNTINVEACKELISLARPMSVTFHRAIDECADIRAEIKQLSLIGVDRILSSGGKRTAEEGIPVLKDLILEFQAQIIIMPGGGIRSGNILKIKQQTGAEEFHSAALESGTTIANKKEIQLLLKNI